MHSLRKKAVVLVACFAAMVLLGAGTAMAQDNTIEVTVQFYIPQLDARDYELDFFEMEGWLLERINQRREQYGIHPYDTYNALRVTAIEHSLDMRDNNFSRNAASDGRTHQERHDRWLGVLRTKVTSSHSSSHWVEGPLTRARAHEIIDSILNNETTHEFIMNPTYHYLGIGFSIQQNGRGRLNITMASQPNERAAHRARTPAQREEHRQQTLESVREERGWRVQR
ncbi:MAG: CAP domain-containing protein [Defluviitaleaceae bacterium]|nr:CAP domain-containing protein [Defluviitaleaceae bacterium]